MLVRGLLNASTEEQEACPVLPRVPFCPTFPYYPAQERQIIPALVGLCTLSSRPCTLLQKA